MHQEFSIGKNVIEIDTLCHILTLKIYSPGSRLLMPPGHLGNSVPKHFQTNYSPIPFPKCIFVELRRLGTQQLKELLIVIVTLQTMVHP
mmetsp:Transcript_801/g.2723  ORF Transcript_801/g.2723 Transcript_801/m.2723 type:complete len:89 (+) Transcript_801:1464-1730(+)